MDRKANLLTKVYKLIKLRLRRLFGSFSGGEASSISLRSGDGAWTKIDAQNWKAFLASTTGARLNTKLRNLESTSAIKGAKDIVHTTHSAGITTGISSTLDYIYSLTYTFDRGTDSQEQRQENAEQKAERELLERIGAM
jgi:hypothetical protein